MILQVVAIRDNAVEGFMPPTYIPHVGAAVREFSKMVNDPQHNFSQNPQDFDLYHLGSWNDADGSFTPNSPPIRLLRGQDALTNS